MSPQACRTLLTHHNYAIVWPRSFLDAPRRRRLSPVPLTPPNHVLSLLAAAETHPQLVPLPPIDTPPFEALAQDLIAAHAPAFASKHTTPIAVSRRLFRADACTPQRRKGEMRASPLIACLIRAPDVSVETLAAHLGSRLYVNCEARNEWELLRYYQPNTFIHLRRILNAQQLASLFGPIVEWSFPFQGVWECFKAPAQGTTHDDAFPLAWEFDGLVRDKITEIDNLNEALAIYQEEEAATWPDITAFDQAADIAEQALFTAIAYGIHNDRDKAVFASHALRHGTHFYRHPEIQGILRALKGSGYQHVTSIIGPEHWHEIALTAPH